MDLETANYITQYYSNFYNELESQASKHWSYEFKIMEDFGDTEENRQKRLNINLKAGRMTNDPEVLKLLSEGYDQFKINTAVRILRDHSQEIFLNKCRRCGALARTPVAKQCKVCGFSWHNELIGKVVTHSFLRSSNDDFLIECHISSGDICPGDQVDFYPFGLFEKGKIEQLQSKRSEQNAGMFVLHSVIISGLSVDSQNFLLGLKHSKELEVIRVKN